MIEPRPGDAFQPGDLLNNTYRVESLLGRGGTSDVYRARNEINGRLMALKVLKSEFSENEDFHVLLTREEEIREVQNDAVVRYSENGRTADGHLYLLMDYVEGPGLDKRLKQGPMDPGDIMVICRRVCEGLQAAHARNIVHRDLSPDNIILRNGDPAQAVIIDFGIAKDTNPGAQTIVGNEFAGKYAYAAPEQLNGQTDARSDIYSLGALLLATFRGAAPDIGTSPMEVIKRKAEALDVSGVPEPLHSVITRMTRPDPADRYASAADVLAALDGEALDPDATVIVPVPRAPDADPEPEPQPSTVPPPAASAAASGSASVAAPEGKRSGGVMALGVAVVLAAGGAGGYALGLFDGLLEPELPLVTPYTLAVQKAQDSPGTMVGHAPDAATYDALLGLTSGQMETVDVTLARGEIAPSWGADVLATLKPLTALDEYRFLVSDNGARISGSTTDKAVHERVTGLFRTGLPGALDGRAEIDFLELFLPAERITPVLQELADCGALAQPDASTVGYGPQSPITITGRVAGTATRVQLFDRLRAMVGERQIILDVDVLNPTLCLIETHLPKAPPSEIDVAFSVGDREEANSSGRFFVNENPVIDVVLPADVTDGYLTVSVLDVSGNVFHLLPNLTRQDNSVAGLRNGTEGIARVRVAYSLKQKAAKPERIAFKVDDSTLGKSKVIVLHSANPLFAGLRPTSESASGYAEALKQSMEQDRSSILSLDSRILETALP